MARFIDRTGKRFGKLTVLQRSGTTVSKKVLWECVCDCGGVTLVDACSLATGNTTSCGCYLKEVITKHGGTGKGSYNTWRAMLRRCTNPADKDYRNYGAVGVTICDGWYDYLVFAADMGEPEGAQTLDRIDTYGNYTKENCRWASPTVQCRNVRVRKTSKSGVTGVYLLHGGWYAAITVKNKRYYSRVCRTIEAAARARKQLEATHWGA